MSESDSERHNLSTDATNDVRIDAAHFIEKEGCDGNLRSNLQSQAEGTDKLRVESAKNSKNYEFLAQSVRTQAKQLAARLQGKQSDLDHREARLNTQFAQFDLGTRNARLLWRERQIELDQREASLKEKEEQIGLRISELEEREIQQNKVIGEFQCEKKLNEEQYKASMEKVRKAADELEERKKAIEADRRALNETVNKADVDAKEKELQQKGYRLQLKDDRIKKDASDLARALAEVEQIRHELLEDRQRAEETARKARKNFDSIQKRKLDEIEQKRRSLEKRAETIDKSWAALKNLRSEIGQMHRETLETRLATEELWAQISGNAPSTIVTKSLGQIRTRLSEAYRLANNELAQQQSELLDLKNELIQKHRIVKTHKKHLDKWASEQHKDVEKQAERLAAREQELLRQEEDLRRESQRWQIERLAIREETRFLKAKVERSKMANSPT